MRLKKCELIDCGKTFEQVGNQKACGRIGEKGSCAHILHVDSVKRATRKRRGKGKPKGYIFKTRCDWCDAYFKTEDCMRAYCDCCMPKAENGEVKMRVRTKEIEPKPQEKPVSMGLTQRQKQQLLIATLNRKGVTVKRV